MAANMHLGDYDPSDMKRSSHEPTSPPLDKPPAAAPAAATIFAALVPSALPKNHLHPLSGRVSSGNVNYEKNERKGETPAHVASPAAPPTELILSEYPGHMPLTTKFPIEKANFADTPQFLTMPEIEGAIEKVKAIPIVFELGETRKKDFLSLNIPFGNFLTLLIENLTDLLSVETSKITGDLARLIICNQGFDSITNRISVELECNNPSINSLLRHTIGSKGGLVLKQILEKIVATICHFIPKDRISDWEDPNKILKYCMNSGYYTYHYGLDGLAYINFNLGDQLDVKVVLTTTPTQFANGFAISFPSSPPEVVCSDGYRYCTDKTTLELTIKKNAENRLFSFPFPESVPMGSRFSPLQYFPMLTDASMSGFMFKREDMMLALDQVYNNFPEKITQDFFLEYYQSIEDDLHSQGIHKLVFFLTCLFMAEKHNLPMMIGRLAHVWKNVDPSDKLMHAKNCLSSFLQTYPEEVSHLLVYLRGLFFLCPQNESYLFEFSPCVRPFIRIQDNIYPNKHFYLYIGEGPGEVILRFLYECPSFLARIINKGGIDQLFPLIKILGLQEIYDTVNKNFSTYTPDACYRLFLNHFIERLKTSSMQNVIQKYQEQVDRVFCGPLLRILSTSTIFSDILPLRQNEAILEIRQNSSLNSFSFFIEQILRNPSHRPEEGEWILQATRLLQLYHVQNVYVPCQNAILFILPYIMEIGLSGDEIKFPILKSCVLFYNILSMKGSILPNTLAQLTRALDRNPSFVCDEEEQPLLDRVYFDGLALKINFNQQQALRTIALLANSTNLNDRANAYLFLENLLEIDENRMPVYEQIKDIILPDSVGYTASHELAICLCSLFIKAIKLNKDPKIEAFLLSDKVVDRILQMLSFALYSNQESSLQVIFNYIDNITKLLKAHSHKNILKPSYLIGYQKILSTILFLDISNKSEFVLHFLKLFLINEIELILLNNQLQLINFTFRSISIFAKNNSIENLVGLSPLVSILVRVCSEQELRYMQGKLIKKIIDIVAFSGSTLPVVLKMFAPHFKILAPLMLLNQKDESFLIKANELMKKIKEDQVREPFSKKIIPTEFKGEAPKKSGQSKSFNPGMRNFLNKAGSAHSQTPPNNRLRATFAQVLIGQAGVASRHLASVAAGGQPKAEMPDTSKRPGTSAIRPSASKSAPGAAAPAAPKSSTPGAAAPAAPKGNSLPHVSITKSTVYSQKVSQFSFLQKNINRRVLPERMPPSRTSALNVNKNTFDYVKNFLERLKKYTGLDSISYRTLSLSPIKLVGLSEKQQNELDTSCRYIYQKLIESNRQFAFRRAYLAYCHLKKFMLPKTIEICKLELLLKCSHTTVKSSNEIQQLFNEVLIESDPYPRVRKHEDIKRKTFNLKFLQEHPEVIDPILTTSNTLITTAPIFNMDNMLIILNGLLDYSSKQDNHATWGNKIISLFCLIFERRFNNTREESLSNTAKILHQLLQYHEDELMKENEEHVKYINQIKQYAYNYVRFLASSSFNTDEPNDTILTPLFLQNILNLFEGFKKAGIDIKMLIELQKLKSPIVKDFIGRLTLEFDSSYYRQLINSACLSKNKARKSQVIIENFDKAVNDPSINKEWVGRMIQLPLNHLGSHGLRWACRQYIEKPLITSSIWISHIFKAYTNLLDDEVKDLLPLIIAVIRETDKRIGTDDKAVVGYFNGQLEKLLIDMNTISGLSVFNAVRELMMLAMSRKDMFEMKENITKGSFKKVNIGKVIPHLMDKLIKENGTRELHILVQSMLRVENAKALGFYKILDRPGEILNKLLSTKDIALSTPSYKTHAKRGKKPAAAAAAALKSKHLASKLAQLTPQLEQFILWTPLLALYDPTSVQMYCVDVAKYIDKMGIDPETMQQATPMVKLFVKLLGVCDEFKLFTFDTKTPKAWSVQTISDSYSRRANIDTIVLNFLFASSDTAKLNLITTVLISIGNNINAFDPKQKDVFMEQYRRLANAVVSTFFSNGDPSVFHHFIKINRALLPPLAPGKRRIGNALVYSKTLPFLLSMMAEQIAMYGQIFGIAKKTEAHKLKMLTLLEPTDGKSSTALTVVKERNLALLKKTITKGFPEPLVDTFFNNVLKLFTATSMRNALSQETLRTVPDICYDMHQEYVSLLKEQVPDCIHSQLEVLRAASDDTLAIFQRSFLTLGLEQSICNEYTSKFLLALYENGIPSKLLTHEIVKKCVVALEKKKKERAEAEHVKKIAETPSDEGETALQIWKKQH